MLYFSLKLYQAILHARDGSMKILIPSRVCILLSHGLFSSSLLNKSHFLLKCYMNSGNISVAGCRAHFLEIVICGVNYKFWSPSEELNLLNFYSEKLNYLLSTISAFHSLAKNFQKDRHLHVWEGKRKRAKLANPRDWQLAITRTNALFNKSEAQVSRRNPAIGLPNSFNPPTSFNIFVSSPMESVTKAQV